MTYMGSKRRYAKYLIPIINNYIKENHIKNFIDCFCGGANLADKVNCENIICNDLSPTLIALHQQAQKDFSQIPEELNNIPKINRNNTYKYLGIEQCNIISDVKAKEKINKK